MENKMIQNKMPAMMGAFTVLVILGIVMATAYVLPAPFTTSSSTNGSIIVIGNENDRAAAERIQDAFAVNGRVGSGESLQFQRASNRLNLGESLVDLQSQIIDDDDLPTLLGDREYMTDNGDEIDYTQSIRLSNNLNYTVFQDTDFNDGDPAIGIRIADGAPVLNYTVEFTETLESEIEDDRLVDFEDTDLEMLGRSYTILRAEEGTLELVGGSTSDLIDFGETKTYSLNGTNYEVTLDFIDANEAVFTVNGRRLPSLEEGETVSVDSNTEFVLTEILFQEREGGVERAEFSLGANTLVLEDGAEVEINDEQVDNLIAHIEDSTSGTTYTLESITLEWRADEDIFISSDDGEERIATMPGFGNLQIYTTGFETPAEEEIRVVNSGDSEIVLELPIEGDESFTLPILSTDGSTFTAIGGEDEGEALLTSHDDSVTWDDDLHQYLVASWTSGDIGQSFILEITTGTEDGNDIIDVRNAVTGELEDQNVEEGDVISLDDIDLTVTDVNATANTATLTINSGGSFDRVYTEEGLEIMLPVNGSGTDVELDTDTTWDLVLTEEDTDGDVGAGENITLQLRVDTANDEIEVGDVLNQGTTFAGGVFAEVEDSDFSRGWVASELATRVELDTEADQSTATIFYHGDESFGNVFLGIAGTDGGNATTQRNEIEIMRVTSGQDLATLFANRHVISVGGSCANPLTARLLGVNFPTCSEAFEDETGAGEGEYYIETFNSPFTTGRIATIIAGYETADTREAADAFIEEDEINVGDRTLNQTL